MPFIERDSITHAVKGCYAAAQAGYAEEFLPDNDPVVVAFLSPPPTAEQLRIAAFKADPTRANLVTLIQGSTPAQIDTWLTINVTTLAQARNVLGQLIKLAAGNSVS
jgi:hypothetical protein